MSFAPIVHDLSRQHVPASDRDPFEVAELMRPHMPAEAAKLIDQAWDARTAIDSAFINQQGRETLIGADPEDIASRVRTAAVNYTATSVFDTLGYSPQVRIASDLHRQLAAELKAELSKHGDAVVKGLRPRFDEHAAVIHAAAAQDIDRDTDPAQLLVTGTPAQHEAFRSLPRAVAGLEQIAQLRDSLTNDLGYGPRGFLGLAYVAKPKRPVDVESAVIRYEPEVETAQYHPTELLGNASAFVQVRKQFVGDRWLHLAHGGFKLQLNTATEVEALIQYSKQPATKAS